MQTSRIRDLLVAHPPLTPIRLGQDAPPVLVINPMRDKMVSPAVMKHNYERLAGPKQYIEIDYGHWTTGEAFINEYVDIVDGYLQHQIGCEMI